MKNPYSSNTKIPYYEHIIIGAGPTGLLLGYLFEKYKYNYVILEKEEKIGGYYNHFPLFNQFYFLQNNNIFDEKTEKMKYKTPKSFLTDLQKKTKTLNILFNHLVLNIPQPNFLNCTKARVFYFKNIYNCSGSNYEQLNTFNFKFVNKPQNMFYKKDINLSLLKKNNFKNKKCFLIGLENETLEIIKYLKDYTEYIYYIGTNELSLYYDENKLGFNNYEYIKFARSLNNIFYKKENYQLIKENNKIMVKQRNNQILYDNNHNYFDYVFILTKGCKKTFISPYKDEYKHQIMNSYMEIGQSLNNKNVFFNKNMIYKMVNYKNNIKINSFYDKIKNNYDLLVKSINDGLSNNKNIYFIFDNLNNCYKIYDNISFWNDYEDIKKCYHIYKNENNKIIVKCYQKTIFTNNKQKMLPINNQHFIQNNSNNSNNISQQIFEIELETLYYFLKGLIM